MTPIYMEIEQVRACPRGCMETVVTTAANLMQVISVANCVDTSSSFLAFVEMQVRQRARATGQPEALPHCIAAGRHA